MKRPMLPDLTDFQMKDKRSKPLLDSEGKPVYYIASGYKTLDDVNRVINDQRSLAAISAVWWSYQDGLDYQWKETCLAIDKQNAEIEKFNTTEAGNLFTAPDGKKSMLAKKDYITFPPRPIRTEYTPDAIVQQIVAVTKENVKNLEDVIVARKTAFLKSRDVSVDELDYISRELASSTAKKVPAIVKMWSHHSDLSEKDTVAFLGKMVKEWGELLMAIMAIKIQASAEIAICKDNELSAIIAKYVELIENC